MEKYIDLEKIAAEYNPNEISPAEQRLADVVVAAIRELSPYAVEQSGKKAHEYGVYTEEELETPLTFEAKTDDTAIYFLAYNSDEQTRTIEVSTDDGETWTEFTSENYDGNNTPIATLNAGQKALIRGDNLAIGYYSEDMAGDYASAGGLLVEGQAYVYGNIMSLLSSDGFSSLTSVPEAAFAYQFNDYDGNWGNEYSLFSHPTKKLLLPATTLAKACYDGMFNSCKSLTTAPELPATTMANRCYAYMFSYCTSLTTAPKLQSTTLEEHCYEFMFSHCTSLTTAPELPATTLAESCYKQMFNCCTSLDVAPELPATTLVNSCYSNMFNSCYNLTTAPELPATTLAAGCYNNMFFGCSRLSFVKCAFTTTPGSSYTNNWLANVFPVGVILKKGSWTTTGDSGIPDGWTASSY